MVEKYQDVGLFDRVASLLDIVVELPDKMSDEEAEGLVKLLPNDTASAIGALLHARSREASIAFLKMVGKWIRGAQQAAKEGKKVIIVPFNFPPELIHAFEGAYPITSEVLSTLGVVALEGQGERYWDMAMGLGLPDHICSSNAIELGSILGSTDFMPQAIVSAAPGGCDVNSKIHEFVSNYLGIPQFFLQKPPDDSQRGRDLYVKNTKRLIRDLENFIGEELKEENLRKVLEKANRCTELHHELFDLQKSKPSPVPNVFSLMLYGTRFTMWGTDAGIGTLDSMVRVSKKRMKDENFKSQKEVARCVWAYTSYYYDFMRFFNWMEDEGYSHLGDGLDLYFPETVDLDTMETMVAGIARTAWNMPMTRQVGGEQMSRQWTEDVIYAAKTLNADCVIYCGHHSCKQTWSVVSILRNELMERMGLPLLILQGDSWLKTMTPMSVIQKEIEQFISNVVSKKSGPKRKVRKRKAKRKTKTDVK